MIKIGDFVTFNANGKERKGTVICKANEFIAVRAFPMFVWETETDLVFHVLESEVRKAVKQ